jgi:hypothetical protein
MCRVLNQRPLFGRSGRALFLLFAIVLTVCGCNLRTEPSTPIPTPNIPSITFQFPQNNSTVLEGVDLNIDLVATDPGTGVARVELLIDDQPHQEGKPEISPEVPTFTVKMNWLAQGIGAHSFTAVAYRLDGTSSAPQTIIVEVVPRE